MILNYLVLLILKGYQRIYEVVFGDYDIWHTLVLSKLTETLHGGEGGKIFVVALSLIDIRRLWKTNLSRPAIMY